MAQDRDRTGDWDREEWVGSGEGGRDAEQRGDVGGSANPRETTEPTSPRWVKTQWVGDQGHGAPAPIDPDAMPEGESGLSGDRHNPGEGHWASGTAAEPTGAMPTERPTSLPPDRA